MRKFTFDDTDYIEQDGRYYYKVNYGKNKLEGEYAEDEIGYVEVTQVLPLGGVKLTPIPELQQRNEPMAYVPVEEAPKQEKPKRGRPPKVTKLEPEQVTIPVQTLAGTPVFEYLVPLLDATDATSLQAKLNLYGNEGWELCGFDTNKSLFGSREIMVVFKREKKRVIK